jgi:hypothetical protein
MAARRALPTDYEANPVSGRRGETADGSYRFENRFRYLIAAVS